MIQLKALPDNVFKVFVNNKDLTLKTAKNCFRELYSFLLLFIIFMLLLFN